MNTMFIIIAVLALLNMVSFCLMVNDKRCAKAGKCRVPEKTLFIAKACFNLT